jgi:succinylarginine dihydrolase
VTAFEYNFDGLIGPTHNYAGLALGNVASLSHKNQVSHPKQAALQGLAKMKFMHDHGFKQALLPPLRRPCLQALKGLGFSGSVTEMVQKVQEQTPLLVPNLFSAASMWTANAGTVSPSANMKDGRLHITTANLANKLHRIVDADDVHQILKFIFADEKMFNVHEPLPYAEHFGDEGGANHTSFCPEYGKPGVEFFVYGDSRLCELDQRPQKFPARQMKEAFEAIIRRHGLEEHQVVLAQQNPEAIDAGVFHNDVISVGNQNVLFTHEKAFVNQDQVISELKEKYTQMTSDTLQIITVSSEDVSLSEAVKTYLFNSQLVSLPNGKMALIAPLECRESEMVFRYLEKIKNDQDIPIDEIHFFDLRQSMNNGGGPACLRLRVVLTPEQENAVHSGIIFSDELYESLVDWVNQYYRDDLSLSDLSTPDLMKEIEAAMRALASILKLPLSLFHLS